MPSSRVLSKLLAVLFLILTSPVVIAQVAGTAALTGAVTDPSGAIIVGADVTATNLATGARRSAKTDETGKFLIAQVLPGEYRLDVTATGFRTAVRPRVELPIGITSTLDVVLELGEIAEAVEVQAMTAAVNTNDASMGLPLTGAEIRSLPSLDLNPAGLLSLQAGVAFVPSQSDTAGGYGGVSDFDGRSGAVNGARSDQTNITLDGVDCNDPISGYAFTCVLRATQASLAEFRTTTSNYGADAGGRSGAAQVQLITSSGENTLRGSAYYAHRNEALNANDFFLNKSGVKEPLFRRHIYGASVGGPLVKNRLFLFGNWERMEESLFKSAVRNVPSLSFRDGVMIYQCDDRDGFASCPTSATSVTGVSGAAYSVPAGSYGLSPAEIAALDPLGIGPNAALLGYWAQYPTEINDSSVGDGVNIVGHRFAAPIDNTFNTYISKLDFNAGNHTFFLRGTVQDDAVALEPAFVGADPIRTTETGNRGIAVGHSWIVSSRIVNSLRYGYTRIKLDNAGVRNAEFANVRFIDDLNGFDDPGLPGGTASTLNRSTPTHHIRDDLSWTTGTHTFSMGGEARFIRNARASNSLSFHTFTVNPSWLPDGGRSIEPGQVDCDRPGCFAVPASAGVNFRDRLTLMFGPISQVDAAYNFNAQGETLPEGELVPRRFAANEYEVYFQDQWRIQPSLTVTLGLRYTNATPPWETNGNQVIPVPVDPSLNGSFGAWFQCRNAMRLAGRPTADCGLIETQLGGAANDGRPYFDRDNNNFSPRIGAAWAPHFEGGILGRLFGDGKMSIRGGYSLVYDRMGMALVNTFDQVGAFGLSTAITNQLGGCNIGATGGVEPCVRWTGLSDTAAASNNVLSNGDAQLAPSPGAQFPAVPPSDLLTVSNGLDDTIRNPHAHTFDVSISRELRGGITVEAAYVGRRGRDLPLLRDFATAADVCDPQSQVCAFEAARELVRLSDAGQPLATLAPIAFWENMFPDWGPSGNNGGCLQFEQLGSGCGYSATQVAYDYMIGYHGTAETGSGFGTSTVWQDVDYFSGEGFLGFSRLGQYTFFPAQWVALNTWSTIGRSEYHALQLMLRKRMSNGTAFAVNYTLSKSQDHSSTPERQEPTGGFFTGGYTGSAINAWEPDLEYSYSDFDMRHQLNAYLTWALPFGRGRRWGTDVSGFTNQLIGGWQVSSVVRFNTGLPANAINGRTWPTNWNLQGNATCAPPRTGLNFGLETGPCPETRTTNSAINEGSDEPNPNIFPNPDEARRFFRFSAMGERGQRNVLRGDSYASVDLAFNKTFTMPYSEADNLAVRLEIFNLTNTPYFDTASLNLSLEDPATFGQYSAMLGGPRRMQVSLRYDF
ncbi:MAG TPA: carboxypeptidase-like regulatory domain-containing protein [Vicinamibacterales bacterium]|nr:carboxypeptidase-like regulatory domain-containing protein [Vicinamibacterales bacterium]